MQLPAYPVLLLTIGIWLIVFLTFAYVSLRPSCAVALPILMVTFNARSHQDMSILLCVFIVLRHAPNLRLIKGQENRIKLPFHK